MVVYSEKRVKIPYDSKKLVKQQAGGTTYVKYTYATDNAGGRRERRRTCIGKVCEDDPAYMYPNDKYYAYFPLQGDEKEERERKAPELRVGTFLLLQKAILDEGLADVLKRVLGERCGLFLDIACCMVTRNSNVMQYFGTYAHSHPVFSPKQKEYSDSTISNFFRELGGARKDVEFVNAWNEGRDKAQRVYVSYDSTNKRCQAKEADESEYGGKPKDGKEPVFNFSLLYDHDNEEPLSYELYSGTITDVQQLRYAAGSTKALGYENIGFVLDRGYFSRENVRFLEDAGYSYVIMVKSMKDWVRGLVDDNLHSFEFRDEGRIYPKHLSSKTLHTEVHNFGVGEKCCHLYFADDHFVQDRKETDENMEKLEREIEDARFSASVSEEEMKRLERYYDIGFAKNDDGVDVITDWRKKQEVFDAEYRYCGYFVIITSEEMTAKEAYALYKSRDEVEKLFRAEKAFAPCERVDSSDALKGKQLVEFVALIIYDYLLTRLSDARTDTLTHPNYFTVTAALNEMEKITMTLKPDGVYRLEFSPSKEQKEILKVFGMDEQYLRRHAEAVSDIYAGKSSKSLLNPLTDKK